MNDQAFELLMNKLKDQDKRLDGMDQKLDELISWKIKLAGATLVISAIGGIFIQIFINKIGA